MTALTLEYFYVVENWDQITVKSGETISDRKGKYLRVDGTTAKAMLGNATSSGEVGTLRGLALTDQRYVGDSVTLLRNGLVDFGNALDAMDYGALIYVSDTDGTLADAAGTVTSAIVGYVWPVFEHDGTVKKLAMIDTTTVIGA